MAYIGTQPLAGQYRKLDDISSGFNGATTSFTTSVGGTNVTAGSPQQLLVSLGGVIQQPTTDYTVNTSTIIFTTAPASGLSFFAILMGDALNTSVPADGSITSAKLAGSLSVGLAAGSASTPSLFFSGDANTGIYSPGADQVALTTAGTARLYVSSAGNVGIGTASPQVPLDLISDASGYGLAIRGRSSDNLAQLRFASNNYASIYSELISTSSALAVNVNGSERARIDSSGRLLVGTSSTSQSSRALFQGQSADATGDAVIRLCRGASSLSAGNALGAIFFGDSGHTNAAFIQALVDTGTWTSGSSQPTRLVFSTTLDGQSSPLERMRITNDGAILFGTTNADPVVNNVNGVAIGSDNIIRCAVSGNPAAAFSRRTSDGSVINFHRGSATIVGTISVTTTATAYNTSSDYRLKENVTAVVDGISRLQQLKPSRFNFIADPDKTVDGFLAHEVQEVVPEAITGEKDAIDEKGNPVYQGIDQSKLVPLLTAALQELVTEVENLKAEVAALKAQ